MKQPPRFFYSHIGELKTADVVIAIAAMLTTIIGASVIHFGFGWICAGLFMLLVSFIRPSQKAPQTGPPPKNP